MNKFIAQRLHLDIWLVLSILALCALGLVTLYSASGESIDAVTRQALRMAVAFAGMLLLAQLPPALVSRWSAWFYVVSLLLLMLVLVMGEIAMGAKRWLDLGPLTFQPSELLKIAVPIVLAGYFGHRTLPPNLYQVLLAAILILVPVGLIAIQPDLGTAVIVTVAGFTVLFMAGLSWRLITSIGLLGVAFLPVLWFYFMREYQRDRVLTFLDPETDPLGTGYHIIQSTIAIGSGGLYGKGWLNGTQSHLDFLPERSTDFIFSVFCEEFGLMGVLALVSLYLFIIARGLYIAVRAQDTFGKLLAAGLTSIFFVYIFVNIGMVSGQLPVVGVPLPLVSQGGTSMVTIMAAFGLMMSIHTHRRLLSH